MFFFVFFLIFVRLQFSSVYNSIPKATAYTIETKTRDHNQITKKYQYKAFTIKFTIKYKDKRHIARTKFNK